MWIFIKISLWSSIVRNANATTEGSSRKIIRFGSQFVARSGDKIAFFSHTDEQTLTCIVRFRSTHSLGMVSFWSVLFNYGHRVPLPLSRSLIARTCIKIHWLCIVFVCAFRVRINRSVGRWYCAACIRNKPSKTEARKKKRILYYSARM